MFMLNNSKGINVIIIERVLSQVTATSVRRWYWVKRRRPRCAVPTSDPHVISAEQSLFLTHTACHYKMLQFCSKADLFQAKEAVPNCSTTDLVVKRKEAWRVICWLNTSARQRHTSLMLRSEYILLHWPSKYVTPPELLRRETTRRETKVYKHQYNPWYLLNVSNVYRFCDLGKQIISLHLSVLTYKIWIVFRHGVKNKMKWICEASKLDRSLNDICYYKCHMNVEVLLGQWESYASNKS